MAEDEQSAKQAEEQGDGIQSKPEMEDDPHIKPIAIDQEMKRSYIDYAMSVIIGRALPDARDGFKPVHRRVLFGMHESGMTAGKPFKKSARIVGDVMGKYHPHGDMAIYDTLVRMAQDFSLRYPLVDGQGNFGSVDGDSAAAMRYTESRLMRIAEEMLADIQKNTVDFKPNYDESLQEPEVLPSKLPNLLVNGSTGIAVGMATNIPPHNLREVSEGIVMLIDNPQATVSELMEVVPGPDFPTGGTILGQGGIFEAYSTGRGRLKVRAKVHLENDDRRLVVTEIPYMVNKSKLLEQIADLVKEKRIEGISDLRDESDREGMRVVIDLKRDAMPDLVQNQLFAHTQMETTFGIINLALVDGAPRVLTLKETMQEYIKHRQEVVARRTKYDLEKARERAHILEGLLKALDNLDRVIELIRSSASIDEAEKGLMSEFELSKKQSRAILEMRLQKLTGLEREKLRSEYDELQEAIMRYQVILGDPAEVLKIVREDLLAVSEKYGDERRTEINTEYVDIDIEDLIPKEDVVITVTNTGYIKRIPIRTYKKQHRGGKGLIGMKTKEEDFIVDLFVTHSHDYILFFTNFGKVYWLKAYKVPEGSRQFRGKPVINLLPNLEEGEQVETLLPIKEFDDEHYLIFVTRKGKIKKTVLSAYGRPRVTGIKAVGLDEGDELMATRISDGNQEIIIATAQGKANRFSEDEVRAMGRTAHGVRGIKLLKNDKVVSAAVVDCLDDPGDWVDEVDDGEVPEEEELDDDAEICESSAGKLGPVLLTVTENGFGKRTHVCDYRKTHRGSQGVKNIVCDSRNGPVVTALTVEDDNELIISSQLGMIIRVPVGGIRIIGRATKGVKIMNLNEGDQVVAVAKHMGGDDEEDDEEGEGGEEDTAVDEKAMEEIIKEDGEVEDGTDAGPDASDEE